MAVTKASGADWSAGSSSSSRGGGSSSSNNLTRGQRAAAARYTGMARAAGIEPYSTRRAVQNVQEREERSQASMPKLPLPSLVAALNIGSAMRSEIIRQIEAGGVPVRENGMVIGVMKDGRYTGRQREADRLAMQEANRGDGASQAAQMGAGAPQPAQPPAAPAAPATVRRSALAQQIEAENRRRRLAGMRRLGARTLLSGDRFTADTLGAG